MKKIKSHFKFSKQERSGIFFLLLIIVCLQVVFYFWKYAPVKEDGGFSLDKETQVLMDSLKRKAAERDTIRPFPFNPNFISDYKGYTLGLSLEEIERLHAFRAKNLFVDNAHEFQEVTKVSDSLLQIISPYFKFPEWTKNTQIENDRTNFKVSEKIRKGDENEISFTDLNRATAEALKSINGIGDKLSVRTIKFRDRLGGFMVDEQLYDVYGLEPEVVKRTLERFKVLSQPKIKKININEASVEELSGLIYIGYEIGRRIVEYREVNGSFSSLDELTKIQDFPVDKINRIKLYLTL